MARVRRIEEASKIYGEAVGSQALIGAPAEIPTFRIDEANGAWTVTCDETRLARAAIDRRQARSAQASSARE